MLFDRMYKSEFNIKHLKPKEEKFIEEVCNENPDKLCEHCKSTGYLRLKKCMEEGT